MVTNQPMVTSEQTIWTAELKYESTKSGNLNTDHQIAIAVGCTVVFVLAALSTLGLIFVSY
jgi:hypothetical protein